MAKTAARSGSPSTLPLADLMLPSVQSLSRSLDKSSWANPSGVRRRLLVVEDNLINQKVAMKILTQMGFGVEVANDGLDALAYCQKSSFDAILMDCQMPVMDGFEATIAIRNLQTGLARTPIIALTANALSSEREKCLQAGMDDFLAKPVKPEMLDEVLRRWVPEYSDEIQAVLS